jgi:glutathione S-transferase
MKLYYMPGACSIGIHVLLEEIGKPYDVHKVDGAKQEQYGPDFVALNPKSKVPTPAARRRFGADRVPGDRRVARPQESRGGAAATDADGEARALEAMDYAVSTMHMQGFSRMFRPGNYAPSEADHDKVKARGKEIMEKGLALMDKALEGKEYLAGKFSVADAALFYVSFWAAARMKMPLPKNVAAHYERMKARPAVKRVLEQEGLSAAA